MFDRIKSWLGFGTLSEEQLAILAATAIVAGIQVFFTSFLLSLIGQRRRDWTRRWQEIMGA